MSNGIIKTLYMAASELARNYPLELRGEFELTLHPEAYVRLCHEMQMVNMSRLGWLPPVPDIGWLNTDFGTVYISVSAALAEEDAILELRT